LFVFCWFPKRKGNEINFEISDLQMVSLWQRKRKRKEKKKTER